MSRVKDNEIALKKAAEIEKNLVYLNAEARTALNLNLMCGILVDISQSLAVIADSLEEQTSQLRELDENLKVGD